MTPEEMRQMRQINFRQTNAYAMQNGMLLGLVGIAILGGFVLGLSMPLFSLLSLGLVCAFPLIAIGLTLRFRKEVSAGIPFSFSRGFSHTLLEVLYAGIWAGIACFVYMAFFDKGYVFDQYLANLNQPETLQALQQGGFMEQIQQSTGGMTLQQMVEQLREVSAATYAAMVIYFYILSAPLLAVIGGWVAMRRKAQF